MTRFRALLVSKTETGQSHAITHLTEDDLMPGDVTIDVAHSSVNYKDGLAITGKSPIIRKYPLIPGIDLAGTVTNSSHKDYKAGDKVVLGGWGVGEGHHGGYAEVARVNGDWLVPLPNLFSTADAMAIGVAGYTAMLCVMALEEQGVKPEQGEILVTGAAGGVGSVSITLLSKLGFNVVASTGRTEEEAFLKSLGATTVINRAELNTPVKALAKIRWAGAIARRRCCCLWLGARHRFAHNGDALHPARRALDWREFCYYAKATQISGLGQVRTRSRSQKTSRFDNTCETRRRATHRGRDCRRKGARSCCGGCEILAHLASMP
jgi:D-arabinose 1-dehydrogenase-like Zn-dependent alcohol dehydrogenase